MEIRTIRNGFEAFECKFESFERDSKLSNPNSNIKTIRKRFEPFEWKFETFERDSKHSNVNSNHSKMIRSFQNKIPTIRKGFEALQFQCKF